MDYEDLHRKNVPTPGSIGTGPCQHYRPGVYAQGFPPLKVREIPGPDKPGTPISRAGMRSRLAMYLDRLLHKGAQSHQRRAGRIALKVRSNSRRRAHK